MINLDQRTPLTLLDGGMGRELLRIGAPFQQPEWSALSLMEAPSLVQKVHESFAMAGSDILTTSNYAVVPFHIGEQLFARDGARLTALSGKLAKAAGAKFGCKIAGAIPPLFGSYRPDLFDAERALPLLKVIIDSLDPYVDFWLAETVCSTEEAAVITEALATDPRPLWLSFSLQDTDATKPRLRSSQPLEIALDAAINSKVSAILFNCSQPETMTPAVDIALQEITRRGVDMPVGVYANAFPVIEEESLANASLNQVRADLNAEEYLGFVEEWCRLGATIIGGCCGIGPEHISAIHSRFKAST